MSVRRAAWLALLLLACSVERCLSVPIRRLQQQQLQQQAPQREDCTISFRVAPPRSSSFVTQRFNCTTIRTFLSSRLLKRGVAASSWKCPTLKSSQVVFSFVVAAADTSTVTDLLDSSLDTAPTDPAFRPTMPDLVWGVLLMRVPERCNGAMYSMSYSGNCPHEAVEAVAYCSSQPNTRCSLIEPEALVQGPLGDINSPSAGAAFNEAGWATKKGPLRRLDVVFGSGSGSGSGGANGTIGGDNGGSDNNGTSNGDDGGWLRSLRSMYGSFAVPLRGDPGAAAEAIDDWISSISIDGTSNVNNGTNDDGTRGGGGGGLTQHTVYFAAKEWVYAVEAVIGQCCVPAAAAKAAAASSSDDHDSRRHGRIGRGSRSRSSTSSKSHRSSGVVDDDDVAVTTNSPAAPLTCRTCVKCLRLTSDDGVSDGRVSNLGGMFVPLNFSSTNSSVGGGTNSSSGGGSGGGGTGGPGEEGHGNPRGGTDGSEGGFGDGSGGSFEGDGLGAKGDFEGSLTFNSAENANFTASPDDNSNGNDNHGSETDSTDAPTTTASPGGGGNEVDPEVLKYLKGYVCDVSEAVLATPCPAGDFKLVSLSGRADATFGIRSLSFAWKEVVPAQMFPAGTTLVVSVWDGLIGKWVETNHGVAWVCVPEGQYCDTLCADGFDDADADAICRAKGFSGGTAGMPSQDSTVYAKYTTVRCPPGANFPSCKVRTLRSPAYCMTAAAVVNCMGGPNDGFEEPIP